MASCVRSVVNSASQVFERLFGSLPVAFGRFLLFCAKLFTANAISGLVVSARYANEQIISITMSTNSYDTVEVWGEAYTPRPLKEQISYF